MTKIFNKRTEIGKRKILRRNTPVPENILWQYLKNRKVAGQKFRRQFSIGRYVADFYCPSLRLIIEIDGPYHMQQNIKENDAEREKFMKSLEIECLRFSNTDVEENIENVINKISSFSISLRRRGRA